MPQDFKIKKKILDISYYWFFLKSYPAILILMAPIVLETNFHGSYLKLSEKNLWFKWLRHFLLELFY